MSVSWANIRLLTRKDIPKLKQIHERDYPDLEFFVDRPLLSAFVVEDDDKQIILAGGIEGIGEALLLTDKTQSRVKIGKALVQAQRFAMFTCANRNIQELYAFVHDEDYAKHLIKHGFEKREDMVLRMKL
jgi:hypothetical protein